MPPILPASLGVSGDQISADAQRYIGHPYVWGSWDCSGMVSHVLSADLGLAIPGYQPGDFRGPPPHGPVVSDYIAWGGARNVGIPAPGDLVCFGPDVHIGIAVSASRMVSALNPQLGTQITDISSTASGQIIYRRVTGTIPGRGARQSTSRTSSSSTSSSAQVLARVALVVLAASAGVLVVGGLVAFGVGAITAGVLGGGRQRPVTRADL